MPISIHVAMLLLCSMNIIKQKAISILEKKRSKTGTVLGVRAWEPATFFEIDLHLPECDMQSWTSVQHMKCKVADFTYRDYTPASWDADTHTCTLYIDTAHDGPGSKWAASLSTGDTISYVGIAPTSQKPATASKLVCMGDASSIGNVLALQQLAPPGTPVSGAIAIAEKAHHWQFAEYFHLPLDTVAAEGRNSFSALSQWIKEQPLSDASIYITGHIPTVTQLRKLLKKRNDIDGSIRAQGFWS